ncbi:FKBP-type peptidyl-prolyl cis-trans isomerase [Hymenobacter weizhouensis]|uniref:FKBP-type peptidyl-prolyl cis-trans isomerase n=1 Tax=Hymenobacter sp. YIM 151500-1 TaxID=2987689 RepID=UPI002225C448|nr:FKBP-type peptidyl-prolyl cis-trans isomerase [Hymenobacter sp. YIM 151500-1]UYZ61687.1 FKBP-type peptidyl-prolyl cis-trans isomerase [Hymenobacter sp. YIM 151500-1]
MAVWLSAWPAGAAQAQTQLPAATPPLPTDTLLARATATASGLRYLVRQPGSGQPARAGDRVRVHYTGFLPDGRLFDASVKQGGPLKVRAGRGEVIKGWDEVLLLLPPGSRARVWIPAHLAYGPTGVRDPDDDSRYLVPPNTDLLFELEVVEVR